MRVARRLKIPGRKFGKNAGAATAIITVTVSLAGAAGASVASFGLDTPADGPKSLLVRHGGVGRRIGGSRSQLESNGFYGAEAELANVLQRYYRSSGGDSEVSGTGQIQQIAVAGGKNGGRLHQQR